MQGGGGGVALIPDTAMEKSTQWKKNSTVVNIPQTILSTDQLHGRQSYSS